MVSVDAGADWSVCSRDASPRRAAASQPDPARLPTGDVVRLFRVACGAQYRLHQVITHPAPPGRQPVRAPGCKNRPAPFPGRMSYRATKPGMSVLSLSLRFFEHVCCV